MTQGQITWFEIPVIDIDRAIQFYSIVLQTNIEKNRLLDKDYGVFNKYNDAIKGALVVKENHKPGVGVVLFFYVIDHSLFLMQQSLLLIHLQFCLYLHKH